MKIEDLKITKADFTNRDITSLPDKPSEAGMTAEQLKDRFDSAAKYIIMPKFNDLIDYLGGNGADGIGVKNDKGEVVPLQELLDMLVRFTSEDVKYIRINENNQLQTSADGETWETISSSGHAIVGDEGESFPQRSKLKFVDFDIEDDAENDTTIIKNKNAGGSGTSSNLTYITGDDGVLYKIGIDENGLYYRPVNESDNVASGVHYSSYITGDDGVLYKLGIDETGLYHVPVTEEEEDGLMLQLSDNVEDATFFVEIDGVTYAVDNFVSSESELTNNNYLVELDEN